MSNLLTELIELIDTYNESAELDGHFDELTAIESEGF